MNNIKKNLYSKSFALKLHVKDILSLVRNYSFGKTDTAKPFKTRLIRRVGDALKLYIVAKEEGEETKPKRGT